MTEDYKESTRSAQFYVLGCRLDGSLVYRKHVTCVVSKIRSVQTEFQRGRHELAAWCHILKLQPLCEISKAYFEEFPELLYPIVSPYSKEIS